MDFQSLVNGKIKFYIEVKLNLAAKRRKIFWKKLKLGVDKYR